jgi:hypothetical protein
MKDLTTFCYAYIQVALICLNTWQIANSKLLGAIIVGFLISLVWCFNTQRVAFSNLSDKIIYATGASLGTASGILLSALIY